MQSRRDEGQDAADPDKQPPKVWTGDLDPFSDQEERQVLFAALDSFRYVLK